MVLPLLGGEGRGEGERQNYLTDDCFALSGLEVIFNQTRGVAPGCHIAGFQPLPEAIPKIRFIRFILSVSVSLVKLQPLNPKP